MTLITVPVRASDSEGRYLTPEEEEKIADLIMDNKNKKEEIDVLESLVETYKTQLKTERDLHDDYVESTKNEIKTLHDQIDIYEEMVNNLKSQVNILELSIKDLRESYDGLYKNYESLMVSYEELSLSYDNLDNHYNEQINNYVSLVDEKDAQISDLKSENRKDKIIYLGAGVIIGVIIMVAN